VLLNSRKVKLEQDHAQRGAILVGISFLLRPRLRRRRNILEAGLGRRAGP
jgi:hypothetical protein